MLLLSCPKGLSGIVHDGADRVFLYACSCEFTFFKESVELSSFINLYTIFQFNSGNYLLLSTLITLFLSFHRSQNSLNQDLGTTFNNQSLSHLQIDTQDLGMQIDRNLNMLNMFWKMYQPEYICTQENGYVLWYRNIKNNTFVCGSSHYLFGLSSNSLWEFFQVSIVSSSLIRACFLYCTLKLYFCSFIKCYVDF